MDRNVTFGIIRRSPGYIPYRTRSILAACDLMNGVVFSRSSASRVTALTCLLCLLCAVPCWAQQYTVLTLLATRREAPGNVVYDEVVQRVLSEKLVGTVDHYSEYLEIGRFEHPEYLPAVRAFVRQKYSGVRFDLILASTNAAVEFLQEHREELFPGVPVVFSAGPGLALGPNSTGVWHTLELAEPIRMALQLQPELRQVFVVSGASQFDKYYEDLARRQLQAWNPRLRITYWSGLPLGELLKRVSRLPPDAILYPLPMIEDGAGDRFHFLNTFDRIAAASSVPVYGWWNLLMGRGIVGGAMHSTHVVATDLAELAARVLRGERPDDIPVVLSDSLVREVDWRQLQRWGISETRLPAGTTVRFRQPSAWERYRAHIIGTVVLVMAQTALIAGLLIQRRRRQGVESALRASYRRNQDLAGQLITAQEAERARIARDLHDDMSQQVAGLAISLSAVKARWGQAAKDPEFDRSLHELQHRMTSLGEEIRILSHQLHPGVLQHAGLLAALRSYCSDFERRHGIAATLEATSDLGQLEPGVSLCLYRVAQEALTNAARHSGARSVRIVLTRAAENMELTVIDDGAGFEPLQDRIGLGLRSIEERVRLARGRARIESRPGAGTRVLASIPLHTTTVSATTGG